MIQINNLKISTSFALLIAAFVLVPILMAINTKSAENVKEHEYISMYITGNDMFISKGLGDFEEVKVKDQKESGFDFKPLLSKIQYYESQGYELVESDIATINFGSGMAIMRRLKQ